MNGWLCGSFRWLCGLFRRRPLPEPRTDPFVPPPTSASEARSAAAIAEAERVRKHSARVRQEFALADVLFPPERPAPRKGPTR